MRTARRILALVLLVVALNQALAWAAWGYFSAPPPSGERYRLVGDWPAPPDGLVLGQVSGVGVDSRGDVFVFRRAERAWQGEELNLQPIASAAVLQLDGETGELVAQWGAGEFVMPHSLTIDAADNVWLTDVGLHQVFKCDRAGNQLMVLGERGAPGAGPGQFDVPHSLALDAGGRVYVADRGNACADFR